MKVNIEFYPQLYLSEDISGKKLNKIKNKLINKPLMANVHVICLANNPNNQLEIYDARQLFQKFYSEFPIYVIGIAGSYDEAIEIVTLIAEETIKETGHCNIRDYLEKNGDLLI